MGFFLQISMCMTKASNRESIIVTAVWWKESSDEAIHPFSDKKSDKSEYFPLSSLSKILQFSIRDYLKNSDTFAC